MNFSLRCLHLHSEIKIRGEKYEIYSFGEFENTIGIVNFCKEAKKLVVANRNGLPKLVLMSREVYENGLGRLTNRMLLNVHRDMSTKPGENFA